MSEPEARKAQYRKYLEAELEAAATYAALAELQEDPQRAQIFRELVQAELRHASRWAEKLGIDPASLRPASGGLKLKLITMAVRWFGLKRILPLLLRWEARDMNAYAADPEAKDIAVEERRHSKALYQMVDHDDPLAGLRAERGFLAGGGGSLRAAVLGINDGLVSNLSLVMGVAGGTGQADVILLAGIAGLMAGAFSMAAGEYVSMRSQRDVYEHQIRVEEAEIQAFPEEEEEELTLIYRAKGLAEEDARRIARTVMTNRQVALDTMAREELGLDPNELGSPWGAAISSFLAFVAGAIVPILPYIFGEGSLAFTLSAVLSMGALFIVGATLAALTSRSALWGGGRMLIAGGSAAAVTYGVGSLVGFAIIG